MNVYENFLINTVGLTKGTLAYFLEDSKTAINLGYANPIEYYTNPETQHCIKAYTLPEFQLQALSGLNQILKYINESK